MRNFQNLSPALRLERAKLKARLKINTSLLINSHNM